MQEARAGPGRRTSRLLLEKRPRNVAVDPPSAGPSSRRFACGPPAGCERLSSAAALPVPDAQAEGPGGVPARHRADRSGQQPQHLEKRVSQGEAASGLWACRVSTRHPLPCQGVCRVRRPVARPLRLRALVEHLRIESTEWHCGRRGRSALLALATWTSGCSKN